MVEKFPFAQAGGSALASPDAVKRLTAAQAVFKSRDASSLAALEEALANADSRANLEAKINFG